MCVTEIDKSKYEDVMPGETYTWDEEEFEVPSVTPPCLEECKIITINHYLKVGTEIHRKQLPKVGIKISS